MTILGNIAQAAKDTWNGEHRCADSGCNEVHSGSPVRSVGGKYFYYCSKHKTAGGGTKPVNIHAEAEKAKVRKAKAEKRRAEREAEKKDNKKAKP